MLFHRDFHFYTGGHGKVWDYFRHALSLGWDARVYLTPQSLRHADNPWMAMPERIEPEWRPQTADVLFLAGMDWRALRQRAPGADRPVVNLVQHVRHGDPGLPLREFLVRRAHRICVSHAVAAAITATGEVNGPVTVIPASLDLQVFNLPPAEERETPVFVGALKNPPLGAAIQDALTERGLHAELACELMPRAAYLARLTRARLAILLPHAEEGFYLPALEAMALGTPVLTLDAIGNRDYLRHGENAWVVAPDAGVIAAAAAALLADSSLLERLAGAGRRSAAGHDPSRESAAFATVLESMGKT